MAIAILTASLVAAAAAVAGLARSWWRDRPRLHIEFRGFSSSDEAITLVARVENYGSAPVYQVDAYTVVPGILLGREPTLGRFALRPGEWRDLDVVLPRPMWADLPETDDFVPKLNVRDVGVLLIYGGRQESHWVRRDGLYPSPARLGRVKRWRARAATARSATRRRPPQVQTKP